MKQLLLLSYFLCCGIAEAQFTRGYLFIAPTPTSGPSNPVTSGYGILPPASLTSLPAPGSNWYSAGGGLERVFGNHVGVGLDLAGILPGQGKIFDATLGTVSPNLYLHLGARRKSDAYLTAGYTLLFHSFTVNAVNGGVGWNYWFQENLGLLVEGRTIYVPSYTWPNPPKDVYVQIRFGLTFR